MYYEEREIDGILYWKSTPTESWIPFTPQELLDRIKYLRDHISSRHRSKKRDVIRYKVRELIYDYFKKDNIDKICDKIFDSGCIDIDSVNEKEYNLPKKIVCVISQELNDAYAPINEDDLTEINNMYRMI